MRTKMDILWKIVENMDNMWDNLRKYGKRMDIIWKIMEHNAKLMGESAAKKRENMDNSYGKHSVIIYSELYSIMMENYISCKIWFV